MVIVLVFSLSLFSGSVERLKGYDGITENTMAALVLKHNAKTYTF